MRSYILPWKNFQELSRSYQIERVKPLSNPDTYKRFETMHEEGSNLDSWEEKVEEIKKASTSRICSYAVDSIIAEHCRINTELGLKGSNLQAMEILFHDLGPRFKNELEKYKRQIDANPKLLFPILNSWLSFLNERTSLREEDLKQESAVSAAPFYKNLSLCLTGVGILFFIASCFNKLINDKYAFFDDLIIRPEKLETLNFDHFAKNHMFFYIDPLFFTPAGAPVVEEHVQQSFALTQGLLKDSQRSATQKNQPPSKPDSPGLK